MYRAVAISQRDGSAHANENCGMASGATVIDFDTLGATKSTGAEMRKRQTDQAGGTDLYDLRTAWASYGQVLHVRQPSTWDDFVSHLRAGRSAVLSVWHGSAGGPCLSGEGRYGHGMAVAPEFHSDGLRVLTADPWCRPGKWVWWPLAKLKAGAIQWGQMVYETGGPKATPEDINRVIKELTTEFFPEREVPDGHPLLRLLLPDTDDVGGAARIIFAASDAHPDVAPTPKPPEEPMPGLTIVMTDWIAGTATIKQEGVAAIRVDDQAKVAQTMTEKRQVYGKGTMGADDPLGNWKKGDPVYLYGSPELTILLERNVTFVPSPTQSDLSARQKQWDADADTLIGPRPK